LLLPRVDAYPVNSDWPSKEGRLEDSRAGGAKEVWVGKNNGFANLSEAQLAYRSVARAVESYSGPLRVDACPVNSG
jgi:hypothetical protein